MPTSSRSQDLIINFNNPLPVRILNDFYKSDLLKRLSLKMMQRMSHQHPIRLRLGKGVRGGSRPENQGQQQKQVVNPLFLHAGA